MVVRVYTNFNTSGKKGASWVRTHVMLVTKNLVGNGAALETDVVALDFLNQIRSELQSKAMTDTFATKEDSIVQLRVRSLIRLASVKE